MPIAFFSSPDLIHSTYLVMALTSSGLLVIQIALMLFGIGGDDMDDRGGGMGGLFGGASTSAFGGGL